MNKFFVGLLAVVLACAVAYAIKSGAMPVPTQATLDIWPVAVTEAGGVVTLAADDFDAIVRIYNQQRAEIRSLRMRGCP